jgi:hypothetical protein
MSRKHFEALAAEIKDIDNMEARLEAAIAVARAAQQFNTKFNKQRFLMACGV